MGGINKNVLLYCIYNITSYINSNTDEDVGSTGKEWIEARLARTGVSHKCCVLEVTFHVNGLDLTYANIWQTSLTDVDIKKMVASISQREVCMQI